MAMVIVIDNGRYPSIFFPDQLLETLNIRKENSWDPKLLEK